MLASEPVGLGPIFITAITGPTAIAGSAAGAIVAGGGDGSVPSALMASDLKTSRVSVTAIKGARKLVLRILVDGRRQRSCYFDGHFIALFRLRRRFPIAMILPRRAPHPFAPPAQLQGHRAVAPGLQRALPTSASSEGGGAVVEETVSAIQRCATETSRRLNEYVVLTEWQGVDISEGDTTLTQKQWGEARVRALLSRFGE